MLDVSQKSKATLKNRAKFKNFIQLFSEQANSNPDRLIVVGQNKAISYGELNRRSNNLASYLRKLGIEKESLVGLCSSLNIDFIVCLLGIIKSGAAYFPLDFMYPKDRLQYMLENGKPSVILTESQHAHLFKQNRTVEIDESIFSSDWEIEDQDADILIDEENLAYVIYTSGSTGKPKGIMVTHKSLPNIALAHNDFYPSNMRMLVSGGVCFDASLLVIFHALANNNPLYLFNYCAKDDSDALLKFLEANSIGYMICIPSQYLKLLQKNSPMHFLKCVSLTGENLPKSLLDLHAHLAPNALLYNEYGPTECAIGTTIAKIYDPSDRMIRQITVGKPLPNTQVYILDQNLNKVRKGSKGEICIGGIGLARGYMNNEALTSEKFIWAKIPDRKRPMHLYRTGDIGRFLPNGELDFLGRFDHSVEICGNSIYLGEIEYHISHHPDVKESAVVVQNIPKKEKRLVAFITTSKNKSVKNQLLQYLTNLLPKHMIPTIVQIDKFPLSPNGKIDREELLHYL